MELTTYLLLVILRLSASNAYVEIIHKSKNWFEAKSECEIRGGRLAGPDELHASTCANKSMNIWLNKFTNERLTPWIGNIGCFSVRNGKLPKPPLFKCYQSCGNTPFGYRTPWCSCEDGTSIGFISPSSCMSGNDNAVWLYNNTQLDLYDDDYTMDCISAQCKDNKTKLKAVDCSSNKLAKCQQLGSSFIIPEMNTQANSIMNCNKQSAFLISEQICSPLGKEEKNTPEFWTGIKRYRYNITGNDVDKNEVQNSDIVNCGYGRCPIDNATVQYTKNCRHKQDGFACIYNDTSDKIPTVKPSSESLSPSYFISASLASSFYVEDTSSSLKLVSDNTSTHIVSSSINTRSTSAITNHNYRSTQAYSTKIITFDKVTEFSENNTIESTPSRDSNTNSFNHNTVTSNSESMFPQPIITTSETSSNSKNVPQQSSVKTNIHEGIQSSGSTYVKSSKESSILPTSVTSTFVLNIESTYDVVNTYTSINTVLISTKHNNIGLIVGISVSILCLVVLVIGIFVMCRLRKQRAFIEKSPINSMKQYEDIGSNSEKDTIIFEKDLTHPAVSATDYDTPFRLTDNTLNGDANKPNDPYAAVIKKPVTTKPDNTPNSKTIKSDIAHDVYSVVMKIPKKDMDKDEQTSLDIPDSTYDSTNQLRSISDNESGNIYDTSTGRRDESDPKYDTTTHVQARKEQYESDYDHL